jgi:steroid 5-alpha reductase family enzyme
MSDFLPPWFMAGIFTLVLFTLTWVLQLRTKNAAIVDTVWAVSYPLQAMLYFVMVPGFPVRQIILVVLVSLWGFRLGLYLLQRTQGHPEDARYTALRNEWGHQQNWKMLRFYWFQAWFAFLLATPFLLINLNTTPDILWIEWIGFGIFLVAWIGESIADAQLQQFKKNPSHRGKICRQGLWKYSRHPNYFFEWLIWVGIAWIALGSAGGYIAWLCPLLMYYFLVYVTGIKYTEDHMLRTRGDAFRDYQQRTSAFFPWFTRK